MGEEVVSDGAALRQELNRIRQQNVTLKRHCKTEKQRFAQLERVQRDQEQQVRAAVEQNDILQFNVQRLTKRIESILAEQKNEQLRQGTLSWLSSFFPVPSVISRGGSNREKLEVYGEDLHLKIKEISELHLKLEAMQAEYKTAETQLQAQINNLRKELSNNATSFAIVAAERDTLETSMVDKNATIERLQADLKGFRAALDEQKALLKAERKARDEEVAALKSTLHSRLPFDDTKLPLLNTANVWANPSGVDEKCRPLLQRSQNFYRQLLSEEIRSETLSHSKLSVSRESRASQTDPSRTGGSAIADCVGGVSADAALALSTMQLRRAHILTVVHTNALQSSSLPLTPPEEDRETAVRAFYQNKLDQMQAQIGVAGQKLSELEKKCAATQSKADYYRKELNLSKVENEKLFAENRSSAVAFQGQIATMSNALLEPCLNCGTVRTLCF